MANLVTDKCNGCGSCVRECPNGAIALLENPKKVAYIDPKLCDECADNEFNSACIAVCPDQAILKGAVKA